MGYLQFRFLPGLRSEFQNSFFLIFGHSQCNHQIVNMIQRVARIFQLLPFLEASSTQDSWLICIAIKCV